ncbi:MAG: ABC transporter permease [Lachnospiraceae bacterium]|nr:ABC transporter permease [Lachnospiraceae bacterium]
MNHTAAIFKKQLKDTCKNKTILIQFVMFPVLTLVMHNMIKIDGMPKNFFVNLFAVMYMGMAPLTSISAVIAEEKEKNTLRVLLMSNVKPCEYLLGIGSHIWTACMLGAAVICTVGNYRLQERIIFMILMAAGIFISLLLGAAIGIWSKNQMMASSIAIPVMMVLSFLPMLSMFHDTVRKVGRFIYSEQINRMISQIDSLQIEKESICILGGNLVIFVVLFLTAYRKWD